MLDTDTKRRIDTARDILVGKVPDPKSQVEQITIALIYKFMHDMDQIAEEHGGKRTFFAGDFSRYAWPRLMSPEHGGQEVLNLYAEAITKMPQNGGIPPLFRDIFKNAFLPYRDPETLRLFLKEIDGFTYDHSERLGDAFEYLLCVLGSQGDAGQFRTPRHIIDFIVQLVDPKKTDRILDPACGTAGFLIAAYKHIISQNQPKKGRGGKTSGGLTPDEKARLGKNLVGYDISPDMVRLSLVNLYLHGFTTPGVEEYDTLTSTDHWNEQFDVILANPPFMTPKGGIKPHGFFGVQSNRTEVLFLDYIIEHLSCGGKAGIVIPEGIHYSNKIAVRRLREKLIEDSLVVDVTLPHGVFKPYASVKTHILILDGSLAKKKNDVLFIEIENDGFTQTSTRRPIAGSQIESARQLALTFLSNRDCLSPLTNGDTAARSFTVTRQKLLSDPLQHLLGRWHDLPNRVTHTQDADILSISDICDIEDGLTPNMATDPGEFPLVVPAEERKSSEHYDFEGKAICVPLASSAGHGKAEIKRIHYQDGKFSLATTMCALFVKDEDVVMPEYLYVYMQTCKDELIVPLMKGTANVSLGSSLIKRIRVAVPSVEIQREIVTRYFVELESAIVSQSSNKLIARTSDPYVRELAASVLVRVNELAEHVSSMNAIDRYVPVKVPH